MENFSGCLKVSDAEFRLSHAGQHEIPHVAPMDVSPDAIPLVLDAGEMVRLDLAGLESGRVELFILE